jgi:hypothetical protein
MTYLDLLNEVLAMTPDERKQQVNLYEDFGMSGFERMYKVVVKLQKNRNGEIQAVVE